MPRRSIKRRFRCGIIVLCSLYVLLVVAFSYMHLLIARRDVMVQGWEKNISRSTPQYVLPDNDTTIINIHKWCPTDLFLVVIVCSAPANIDQRSAIRDTWASLADDSTRVVFLLGEFDNFSLQIQIQEESAKHDDIVQEGFLDSYNNLTIKSVMMLKWVKQYCSFARFVIKTDDDIYLNIPAISKELRSQTNWKDVLVGHLFPNTKPVRNPNMKWFTPWHIFDESYFPKYLSGSAYLMSQDVVPKLYKAALSTPIIHLEDVYITGICARAAGVKPHGHRGFFYDKRKSSDSCNPLVFTSHRLSPDDLREAFSYVHNNCSRIDSTHRPNPHTKHLG